jgi:hypothetical protein
MEGNSPESCPLCQIAALRAENERLREALKWISDYGSAIWAHGRIPMNPAAVAISALEYTNSPPVGGKEGS